MKGGAKLSEPKIVCVVVAKKKKKLKTLFVPIMPIYYYKNIFVHWF